MRNHIINVKESILDKVDMIDADVDTAQHLLR
jgi:hypothetical protein